MLKIQCFNEKCTAPGRIFQWNERPHLEADGRLAKEGDEGAVSFVELCPSCGTRNKIPGDKGARERRKKEMI